MPAIIKARHCDQNRPHSALLEEKWWRERPGSTDLCECVSKQQAHERRRNEPYLKHSPSYTVHPESVTEACTVRIKGHTLIFVSNGRARRCRLTCLHYNVALFGPIPLMSRLGLCSFPASQPEEFIVQTVSSSAFLGLFITPKHWEAVICIYIRSLDQARGLLAQGELVFPSAVSSDSRHASSGYLCTACIRPWSLSTSKLSCRLSLSHSPSLSFSFFWSLFPLSHFIMWYLHCHCHLRAESHRLAFFPPLPSFIVPSLQHCTISVYFVCYVFSCISSFCQKFNVALKSGRPSGDLRVGGHQEPFVCIRKFVFCYKPVCVRLQLVC